MKPMRGLFVVCLIVIGLQAQAQFELEENIIIPLGEYDSEYAVIPAGNDGLLLFHEVYTDAVPGKRKYQVLYLDDNLDIQWSSAFESDMKYKISKIKYIDGYIYFLFKDSNVPMKSIFFARTSLNDEKFELFQLSEFLPREVHGFEVLGNSLFLIGQNGKLPAILKYSYGDPRPVVLQGLYNGNNVILNTTIEEDHIQIVSRLKEASQYSILVKQFDENGEIIKYLRLRSNKGYQPVNAIAKNDQNGHTIVIGSFTDRKSKQSRGIFTTVFNGEQSSEVYYYNYTNLHNYFNYLMDSSSIEKAKKRYAKSDQKQESSYRVKLAPRSVYKYDGIWHFTGEVIEMIDRSAGGYGTMWKQEHTQYSHAVLLGIGEDGKLVWDNSFNMHDITSYRGDQLAFTYPQSNNKLTFYSNGLNIHYKIFDDKMDIHSGAFVEEMDTSELFPETSMEKTGQITPWFGNNFLSFGVLTARRDFTTDARAFYVNKLAIKEQVN